MKKLTIETGKKNEILRTVSDEIPLKDIPKYKGIAQDMLKHIKNPKNWGVWLAAPQIGINKRIIVVSLMKTYEDENFRTIAMINPRITGYSTECTLEEEWCLSVPWETGDVERYASIELEFYSPEGSKYNMKLDSLAARIVQHEIDHLDGILFTDKLV